MSPRPDPLDVIYEDDETDEGAISADGGTSLHGHPDHEHADEDVRALAAENVLLRENVNELIREVARADAEMARWRSRCRKIEDERDALTRELDRFKAELERRHARSQSMVVYSTAESNSRADQHSEPMYHPGTSLDGGASPPPRFASPRMHALPLGAAQPYTRPSLPSIAVSPTREPTPPGAGVPTHRGRLAPPRTGPTLSVWEGERGRKRESHQWEQPHQNRSQKPMRERNSFSWEQSHLELESSKLLTMAQRGDESSTREFEQAQQEWEHVQFLQEHERNTAPVVYSTGASDGWSFFDILRHSEGWNVEQSPTLALRSLSLSSPPQTPVQTPLVYSSAYPHPNGHGQGRHIRDEGPPGRIPGRQDGTILSPYQLPENAQVQQQLHSFPPEFPEKRRTVADDALGIVAASASASSLGSTSSSGSQDAAHADSTPRTPPDPAPAPAAFALSAKSPAFFPTGLRAPSPHVLSAKSPPFQPQTPVVDPEYGPVIVHGPLPPRHVPVAPGQGQSLTPRRKREPSSVPPRHMQAGGKGAEGKGFGGATFGGTPLGVRDGIALAPGERSTDGEGVWAWGGR